MGNSRSPVLQMRVQSRRIFYAAVSTWIYDRYGCRADDGVGKGRPLLHWRGPPAPAGVAFPSGRDHALALPTRVINLPLARGALRHPAELAKMLCQRGHPAPDRQRD